MFINKLECYRYYSDLAGFDLVVIVEEGNTESLEKILDSIIEKWYEGDEEVWFIPLSEYIQNELENIGLQVSLYFNMD